RASKDDSRRLLSILRGAQERAPQDDAGVCRLERQWTNVVAATKHKKGPGVAARTLQSRECPALLARHLVVDALDVKVHAEDLTVGKMVAALALNFLAVLAHDRTFEREQLAGGEGGFGIHRHFL